MLSSVNAAASRKGLSLVDLAIVLYLIHMQAAEYTLDDHPIILSKCGVALLIFTNCHNFKKGAVVSGQYCFGYWTLSDTHAGS